MKCRHLKYVIYNKQEIGQKTRISGILRRHSIIEILMESESLRECVRKNNIPVEAALALATTDQMIRDANELSVAVLGYRNPMFSSEELYGTDFLVESLEEIDYYFLERVYQRKHGLHWRVIETSRCYLREMTLLDLPDLYELYGQEGMTDYMEPLYDKEEEYAYAKAYIQNMYRYYGYGMWLVKDRVTHRLIGRAGLNHCEPEGECVLEMGYAIGVPYQKKGYATEVCRAIIDYAKCADLGFDKLHCFVQPGNEASMALLHKLGFAHMGSCMSDGKKMCKYVVSIQ